MLCLFFVFCFFFSFCCLISGSHHSGSPLARGARYCMSADSSKVYTIPQTSSSGPELVQGSGLGPGSEACGQARTQSSCKFTVGAKATDDDDDDDDAAHSTEEPPNISECGWVYVRVKARRACVRTSANVQKNYKNKEVSAHVLHSDFITS